MESDILIKRSIKVRGAKWLIPGNKWNLCNLRWSPSIFTHNVGFLRSNVVLCSEGYIRTKFFIWAKYAGKLLSCYLWKEWGRSPADVVWLYFFVLNGCHFSLFRSTLTSHRPDWKEQMFLLFLKVPQVLKLSCKLQLAALCTLLMFLSGLGQWQLPQTVFL